MKKTLTLIFLLITIYSYSQETTYKFGEITANDLSFKASQIDATANAVVLYESGDSKFTVDDRNINVNTTYYFKIKIFNKEGFKHGTFSIPIYANKNNSEKVVKIKGITHNSNTKNQTHLSLNNVFTEQENTNWKSVKFTMPNLKENCIIEVSYTVVTPFKFNLTGWDFQSDIPKLSSQYKALIPGNYFYNRSLTGYLKLSLNNSTVKKHCFHVPGVMGDANCEEIVYGMKNIPAFIEEDYMTSKENFISKIKFELAESVWFDGTKKKYTTTWDAVDKEFKSDKNIGIQFKKIKYFEDLIPEEIKNIPNDLDKAKAVYTFIQDHFTWNEKYGIFKNARVKQAFEAKIGNVTEINISLINALKTVGLNTELVLSSTRNHGVPTKLYPIISDFNYVLAKVNINNTYYLLDASQKLNPFGLLPFKCLNSYGRAMDFKNDSYWVNIIPTKNNKTNLYASLVLNEDGSIHGKLRRVSTGYHALNKRIAYLKLNNDEIADDFENIFSNLTVENYTLENKNDINKPIIEVFDFVVEFDDPRKIYFNPFFGGSFQENPFKQEDRLYPVDFGFIKKYNLHFNIELPENYKIESFPKSEKYNITENGASFEINSKLIEDYKYTLQSNLTIAKDKFLNNEYNSLKKLFEHTIIAQKTPLVIKKVETN
ncbi:transglutaminase domain-containing protein [Lutibacter holmesii]|uniref:Transglutaminase domain-containing protein n=1 Tax=Lutibacter holmesii TaxID=1137985 RepID=A0ABW3WPH6_9FLAO